MKQLLAVQCVFLVLSISSSENFDFASSSNSFSFTLHRQLAADVRNLFYSPLGLSTVTTMLFHGAQGKTEQELRKFLHFNETLSKQNVLQGYQQLLTGLDSGVDVASAALLRKKFSINLQYKEDLENYFHAITREEDFGKNAEGIKQYVNEWVKNMTKGHITHFLNTINPQTVLLLLNTMYFEGKWSQRFHSRDKTVFYNHGLKSNATRVPMMGRVAYSRMANVSDLCVVLELEYEGSDINMWVLLPNKRDGLLKLEENLTDSDVKRIASSLEEGGIQLIDLKMPKFQMEYKKDMKSVFEAIGIKTIFGRFANFTGITESENITVSQIIHGAKIEIDELGSVASAGTAVELVPLTYPTEMIVDRPFLFWIIDSRSLAIIFTGRVVEL